MGADSVLDMAVQLAAEGNSSDAEALVRFALSTDPDASHAHVCLARIRAARGEEDAAVDGLVDAVRVRASAGVADPTPLYEMLAAALELAPGRLDLHVDLAELQAAHGDVPGAQARLVQLSAIYVDAGRQDDARDVLAVASGWDPQGSVAGVIVDSIPVEESVEILLEEVEDTPLPQPAPTPRRRPKAATVCTPTLLRDARGEVIPNQDIVPAPATRPRRVPRAATICTPTLLRDAGGHLLPNQQSIPKPAPERGLPSRRPERIPAPPVQAKKKRPSTGRSRTVPSSRTSIRTLRARVRVRHEPEINRDAPLASRLRRLGSLSSK